MLGMKLFWFSDPKNGAQGLAPGFDTREHCYCSREDQAPKNQSQVPPVPHHPQNKTKLHTHTNIIIKKKLAWSFQHNNLFRSKQLLNTSKGMFKNIS